MSERASMTEFAGGKGRLRRVIAGEGMVVARKTRQLASKDGRDFIRVISGLSRVVATHWSVQEHPEVFSPADPQDRATRAQLKRYLTAALKETERELALRSSSYGLGPAERGPPRPNWEL